MTPWMMNVTDRESRLLFTLQFAAKALTGSALYIHPLTNQKWWRNKKARQPALTGRKVAT